MNNSADRELVERARAGDRAAFGLLVRRHQQAEEREERRRLREAVDGLVPEQGEVVRLFYFERLSAREVAARLGISVRAVNTRLHRARRLLGEILEPPEILERLHERFSVELSKVLSEAMGREVETEVAYVDQTTYGEAIDALSRPSCTYAFSLEGLGGEGFMDIPMPVIFGLLGLDECEPRALTEEEQRRVEPVALRLAEGLEKMWAPLVPVAIEGLRLHDDPETIRLVAPGVHVGIYGFEVKGEGFAGLVMLCYPNALMVDPVLPRLELVG